jgi:excisionase family DNA binding protein
MTSRRLTVQEAAEVLGTSVDAVRMRVRRGSLESEKDPDGRVHVWVNGDSTETKPRLDGEPSALISAKDETISTLREQLQAERQAHAEARRLLAAALERIPAIEAPQEPPEDAETVEEAPEGAQPHSAAEEARDELRPHCARGWPRSVAGAKRQSASATACAGSCSPSGGEKKPTRRPRRSRVGVRRPTSLRERLRRAHSGGLGGVGCWEVSGRKEPAVIEGYEGALRRKHRS